jgi:hypothetical protein
MIITLSTYLALALCSSIRYLPVLKWIINPQTPDESSSIELSRNTYVFFCAQTLSFLVSFFGLTLLHRIFYYSDPLYILGGVLVLLLGFYWSIFYRFKQTNYSIPFLLGIYCYFSWHFLWLFPLSIFLFMLLLNQEHSGQIVGSIFCFSGIFLFDTSPLFPLLNTLITAALIIKYSSVMTKYLFGSAPTLLEAFRSRNIHF